MNGYSRPLPSKADIVCSCGSSGLGQQLAAIIEDKRPEFTNQPYDKSILKLRGHLRPVVNRSFETAGFAQRVLGQAAQADAICTSLLAAPFKDGLRLVEITQQVGVECILPDNPFVSMGSGKNTADPFLGFLRSVFWPNSIPTVLEGALAAYWTIQHAIDMKIFGVGFDVDVFAVEPKDKGFAARKLDDAELTEHREFIRAVEDAMRSVRTQMNSAPADSPPTPPPTLNKA